MAEAVKEGHLVDYNPIARTTKRLRNGIKYDSLTEDEKAELDKAWEYEQAKALERGEVKPITPRDIEKKELFEFIYNKRTVDIVLEDLMKHGLKVENGEKIGKSIIFAYNREHAQMIVERFYDLYPGFDEKFCQRIDYSVNYAQDIIDNFKIRENMPQIAVSVDMLDTGVDVPDILNLVFFKPVYSSIKYIQMIGRGTRLCKEVFADGSDKQEFYIFDWCENFEFFKDNKQGRKPTETVSITERIFCLQTDLAVELQHHKYDYSFARELKEQLKDTLSKQVAELNELHASVRRVWDTVQKYKKPENWAYISPVDALELKQVIAPLVVGEKDDNGSKMFDALMLNIELSKLVSDVSSTRSKNKVTRIAQLLLMKDGLPAVKEHLDTIELASNPNFWKGASLENLEFIRKTLRELVYIILGSKHQKFFINISDTLEEKQGVEKPEMDTDYRTRILDYLNEHRDHAAIQKIFRLEQLTIDDTKELEKICWQELGTKEEYEAFVNKGDMLCGDKVAVFIRSIIGIDRKIAKERFSKFLSDNVLTALQEEFINQIIGYVCENGDITPMTIVTNESFDGIVGAFGVNMVNIRQYVEELHEVIA
jgi:type I restriction enzyme R subunit